MPEDELFNELFEDFIERRPRCKAVRLSTGNVWKVAQYLREQGFYTKVDAGEKSFTIEIFQYGREDSLFVANVHDRDAIIFLDYMNLSHIPGREFGRIWERTPHA